MGHEAGAGLEFETTFYLKNSVPVTILQGVSKLGAPLKEIFQDIENLQFLFNFAPLRFREF